MAKDKLNQQYRAAVDCYHKGDLVGAEKLARKVAKRVPKDANALNLLAVVSQDLGKIDEAIRLFERVCQLAPEQLQAYINLGNALRKVGQLDKACRAFESALKHDPGFVAAKINLGATFQDLSKLESALRQFSDATEIAPDYQPAHYNKGVCLRDMRRFEEALNALTKSINLNPADPGSYLERANVLSDLDRDEEAISDIQTALRLRPNWPDAYGNWASFLTNLDRHDEALEKFDKSLALDPANMTNVVNKGLACLAMGDLEQGWPAYLKRAESTAPFYSKFEFDLPPLEVSNFSDKHILVWTEQGLGDQILYAGLIREFAALAGQVTWLCSAKAFELFRLSFADLANIRVANSDVEELQISQYDCQASMVDVAAILRPSMASFPPPAPYLKADSEATAAIRTDLKRQFGTDLKLVGISWASHNPLIGDGKTVPLEALEPVLRMPDVQFVDIQYGEFESDLSSLPANLRQNLTKVNSVDLNGSLLETLNLFSALDLVISCSNTTAHLAAAAGVPTWVLVPAGKARIWYWFLNSAASPWYSDTRLFRRTHGQSWSPSITEIEKSLDIYLKSIP